MSIRHAREQYTLVDADGRHIGRDESAPPAAAGLEDKSAEYLLLFSGRQGVAPAIDEADLRQLGAAMAKSPPDNVPVDDQGMVPAGYTYLGQFIAHEMSFMRPEPDARPENERSPQFDLDSLFNPPVQFDPAKTIVAPGHMAVGRTKATSAFNSFGHDLPRATDGKPQIADARNDNLLPLAQIQQAFIRFYNAAAIRLATNDAALIQKTVIQHFHSIVLHDYLGTLIDQGVYDSVLQRGRVKFLHGPRRDQQRIWLPIEFVVAAFRFGHAMVRDAYRGWNPIQPLVGVTQFWTFSFYGRHPALPRMAALPSDWVISWSHFFDFGDNPQAVIRANRIGTRLAPVLGAIPEHLLGDPATRAVESDLPESLPVRTLLRGHRLGIVSAQEIARQLIALLEQQDRIGVLDREALLADEPDEVKAALTSNGEQLLKSTPLWFYILKEARHVNDGNRLGPLGSRIVMETIHGVLDNSRHSILADANWRPSLFADGVQKNTYSMVDLLNFVGELDPIPQ